MAASALGFSLPDLSINGSVGTRAAWGGTLGVIATVINTGTSTITNPIAQAPGSVTTADAPPSTVAVVITPRRISGPRDHHRHVPGPAGLPEQPGADRRGVHAPVPARGIRRRRAVSSSST